LNGIKHGKYFFPRNSCLFCFSLGHEDNGNCKLFNGTWIRDLRGPIYNNMTCPTMPDSKNCGKYGKQMDYVNWRWMPHGCDMARFEPQLFLNIVQGKTLAFAGDSMGRNQMESLLCLLSQVSKQCLPMPFFSTMEALLSLPLHQDDACSLSLAMPISLLTTDPDNNLLIV
jgi:hypothetical protein